MVVLGCGGDRDTGKRAAMGAAAAIGADVVVITDDNPRSEDPAVIRAAALDGARAVVGDRLVEVLEVGDRQAAIVAAVERARPGDGVVVAGKGHEQGQEFEDGRKLPFDDATVALEALQAAAR